MDNHPTDAPVPPGDEPTTPSPGRIYDYLLNGVVHFEVDKEAAENLLAKVPETYYLAHANRGFLQNATTALTRAGIRQFIDIGAGIPTQWNTHQVAQHIAPEARVVYVDNDKTVLADSEKLLRRRGDTNVIYIKGDACEPASILNHSEVRDVLDFSQPIGCMQVAVWHFVKPEFEPHRLVREYIDALPPGSYLALSHITADGQREEKVQRFKDVYGATASDIHFRTVDEIDRFFTDHGLEYLPPYEGAEPGLSFVDVWGSKNPSGVDPSHTWVAAGVARKPA